MQIENTKDLARKGVSMIIYGDAGVGKTHLIGTLPEGELLVIDVDGGLETFRGMGVNHDYKTIRSMGEIVKMLDWLKKGDHKYKYLAIDNLSELEKTMAIALMDLRGQQFLRLKEYGDTAQKMREYVRKYRDLTDTGLNVFFLAWEMPLEIESNEDGVTTKAAPFLGKKFTLEASGLVDATGRLLISPKDGNRYLSFKGDARFIAKTRLKLKDYYLNPTMPELFANINSTAKQTAKPEPQNTEGNKK